MKVILIGFAATVLIAFAADELLSNSGFSTPEIYSGPAVRLD